MDEKEEITKPESEVTDSGVNTSQTPAKADGVSSTDKSENKKQSDKRQNKKSKSNDKKKAAEDKKNDAKMKKEWEDSIVANKRVKREEVRRKVKQATVILLVFALIVTSVVYVMLLFIQENNVRITASSRTEDTAIALSMDNSLWTPYLNAGGPESIWNISYNPIYGQEKIDTIENVREMLSASEVEVGEMNGEKFIRFVFMVKNTGKYDASLSYEMTLEYDKRGLQNAVRVMWGESFKSNVNGDTDVTVYAARSTNKRLDGTGANYGVSAEDGFIEYVAYPLGSDKPSFSLLDYERTFADLSVGNEARKNGYIATTPFLSSNYVFQRQASLAKDDIMYCYACIWVEGSDFDCVDSAIGGYVKLGINFVAY